MVSEYEWDVSSPPIIKPHSISKHDTLRDYLLRFAKALAPSPAQPQLNIDIIDGFSGGGMYKTESGEMHLGSPLLVLETLKEAEALINHEREKQFKIIGQRIFIDPSNNAIAQLKFFLEHYGYDLKSAESNIQIIKDDFRNVLPKILQKYQLNSRRRNKVIFLLDQYGYTKATIKEIKSIFSVLAGRAEIILTFATDKLINYLSTDPRILKAIESAGLEHVITNEVIEEFRDAPSSHRKVHRVAIQYLVAQYIIKESGAMWSNVLFIRSRESANGAYLYLHLSNNFRARDEMNQVIWNTKNGFVHDAGSGVRMFEYDPANDVQTNFEFEFSDDDQSSVEESLINELLDYLCANRDRRFTLESLIKDQVSTSTPAGKQHFTSALAELKESSEVLIKTPKGRDRRESTNINNSDIIQFAPQKQIYLPL